MLRKLKPKKVDWVAVSQIGANLATVGALLLVASQLQASRRTESAALMFQINEQVRAGTTSHLVAAIDADEPIFEPSGKFTVEDVDNYLMNWELLAEAYDNGLIDGDMAYDAFSYDIGKAWRNAEIHKFIMDARQTQGTPDLYGGVEELAKRLK